MRKICIISGTRADYGLSYWLMKNLQRDDQFELQIVVTGMHLSAKFGNTWEMFANDGFIISDKVYLGEMEDSRVSILDQVSIGVKEFGRSFQRLKPDLIFIVGDRYEMLAPSQVALFLGVPVAHIHGGEITEGAFDDIIRHSITKMSTYHFTSTELHRRRVIQMGEEPERVLNVGAVGLENIVNLQFLSKDQIERELNFKFKKKNFLVTYHPVTAADEDAIDDILKVLSGYSDFGQVFTLPNSDPGHSKIVNRLKNYARGRENVYLTENLGSLKYLSLMKISDVVIGNSSSGIIEAPFLGVPTLNIGVRQRGRLHDSSVVDCVPSEITEKLEMVLNKKFHSSSFYGDGDSSSKIINYIKSQQFKVKTRFYDL